jgi:hypothetical protein
MPVDTAIIAQFQNAFKRQSMLGGDVPLIAERALRDINVGVFEYNGQKQLMVDPPRLTQTTLPYFEKEIKTIAERSKLLPGEYYLEKGLGSSNKQTGYYIMDKATNSPLMNNGKLIMVVPDEEAYLDQYRMERLKPSDVNFNKKAEYLSTLEDRYPVVGQYPGLLNKLWAAESSSGTDKRVSSAGAVGDFQFMSDTAKQYGVKNRRDFFQSATGAARYMSDLLNKYGRADIAVGAYNWGPGNMDNFLQKHNGKFNPQLLPEETRNHITKVLG